MAKNTMTIYITKDAKPIVKNIQRESKRHRLSMSTFVFMCIEAGMGFTVQGLDGMKVHGVVRKKKKVL